MWTSKGAVKKEKWRKGDIIMDSCYIRLLGGDWEKVPLGKAPEFLDKVLPKNSLSRRGWVDVQ